MRVSILCIGNELLLDDGVGPAVARHIESRYALPDDVAVVNCAVMGMAVISELRDCDYALVLDAVDVPGAQPGQLFSFDPDDAATTPAGATSLHDMRFADVLHSASMLGIEAGGHCFGIQVENSSPSEFLIGLTPRVAAAVPFLAQAAMRYLVKTLGIGGVVDIAASFDPHRAGRGYLGERDFSKTGIRERGPEVPKEQLAAWRAPALPEVYGQATAEVAAEYLAAGMDAIGACGAIQHDRCDGTGHMAVSIVLPTGEEASELADRFGLESLGTDGQSDESRYLAFVGSETTDYDLDELIGACLELCDGR